MSTPNEENSRFELEKSYNPKEIDTKWYQVWEQSNFFLAKADSGKTPFTISMPPPNITGVLHMGHALGSTLSDILIRFKRMRGFESLWVPGTDHAGIATQTRVERHLMQTMNKRRKDFPREEFLKHVWEWKEKNEDSIVNQQKKLGCSCDWSRHRFTMDEASNKVVRKVFKKLFDEGLIYRGDYLVNWDPITQTALADDEVEHEEKQSFLWHFKYPIKDSEDFACIATTRPETMLGDTAIAVNPKDDRYKHLIGKSAILPIKNREIPIIADPYVDPEFGSGMVKITPAHDPNDYQMGLNHKLEFINIMTPDGKVNEEGGKFKGLSFEQAREAIVEEMNQLGLFIKKEPHTLRVGISYRSKAVIEPYMSKQWFVSMEKFKPLLRKAVSDGEVELYPDSWKNTYYYWIDNLRDWCISRQLWWGHRIPIWYSKDHPEDMICYEGEGVPEKVKKNPDAYYQDEDVLDTWFSSAFWPFNILGWDSENTEDFETFYPNSVMITGHDILFFWVARMLLMGKQMTDKFPFPKVFLHGLIFGKSYWRKDEHGSIHYVSDEERQQFDLNPSTTPKDVFSKWEKMSKSKGNIIDPLEVIDEYGTDAVRMALCASNPQLSQIDLDRRKFEEFKNFTNKVWNGARFVFMNLDSLSSEQLFSGINKESLLLEDKWILSALNTTIKDVNTALDNFAFEQAASKAYDFFWKEFCAYYVEISKPYLFGKMGSKEQCIEKQKLLVVILTAAVRLLHPMAPFITEELFKLLQKRFDLPKQLNTEEAYTQDLYQALKQDSCMLAPFPHSLNEDDISAQVEQDFEWIQKSLYTIRNIRGEMKVAPSVDTDIYFVSPPNDRYTKLLQENQELLSHLIQTKSISFSEKEPSLDFAATGVLGNVKIIIPLPDNLKEAEAKRLEKEKVKLESNIEKLQNKLQNENFLQRAPKELVQQQNELLTKNQAELNELQVKLAKLQVSK
ncbi:MAG: valine--tRNA ligase [Chlamydiales bacterium]|nr:valine--tRNA ligase [Chlamydiales bacterium]NCF70379.1 valine--tRNA ligase [Chlamydiales bacterium]